MPMATKLGSMVAYEGVAPKKSPDTSITWSYEIT